MPAQKVKYVFDKQKYLNLLIYFDRDEA